MKAIHEVAASETKTVTIANGATGLSDAIDLEGYQLAAIQMPATWVAAVVVGIQVIILLVVIVVVVVLAGGIRVLLLVLVVPLYFGVTPTGLILVVGLGQYVLRLRLLDTMVAMDT